MSDTERLKSAIASHSDRDRAELVMKRAVALFEELEIPMAVVIDRFTTYAAYASCMMQGSKHTAEEFRLVADRIEAGAFAHIAGETPKH